jgi:centromeric protein E
VVSDKQLVKHLQMEVARLEAELRTPDRASSSEIIIMERDRKIRQMEKEMEELKKQRDNAQLKLEELQKKMGDNQPVSICPFLANLLFFQRISASQNHIHLLST